MRIEHFVIGAVGVIGLVQLVLPDRPPPPPRQGIVVVPGAPSRMRPMPVAAIPVGTGYTVASVEPPKSVPRWEGDDQPGIWATPATFSETD